MSFAFPLYLRSAFRLSVLAFSASLCFLFSALLAQETPAPAALTPASGAHRSASKPPAQLPAPTFADVAYGSQPRQVLDFWQAPSRDGGPTPVVFYMHGGGWVKGDKREPGVPQLHRYLEAGISVVSINYRYTTLAQQAGVQPPVSWPMHDAARALQFVRLKADAWHLDRQRIGLSGGSAGACTCLWLAFHADLADPASADPVARESTKPLCVAVHVPQTSLDPQQMKEWIPNISYGGHAFGFSDVQDSTKRSSSFALFLAHREEVLVWIREYSPYEQAGAGAPPVYLVYDAPPALGLAQANATHSANFGVKLKEKLDALQVPCELVYPGSQDTRHPHPEDYLIERLRVGN